MNTAVPVSKDGFVGMRRLKPISEVWGLDRGKPIDRYYIERFLSAHASDVHGHALEIENDTYTRRYGEDRVTKIDVLHAVEGNPKATIVADLSRGDNIPSDSFDCIILTQTLQYIYDVRGALQHLRRIMKPGAALLATFPGISKTDSYDMVRWGDYWRFTTLSAKLLFEEAFRRNNVTVMAYGNVLTAIAFLHGYAAEELTKEELDYRDPNYELLITARATKPDRAQ